MNFEAGQFVVLEDAASDWRARLFDGQFREPTSSSSHWSSSASRADALANGCSRNGGEAGSRGLRPAWPRGIPSGRRQKHCLHRWRLGHCRHDVDFRIRRPGRSLSQPQGTVFFGVRTLADAFYLETLRAMSRPRTAISKSRSRCRMKRRRNAACTQFPVLKLANGMVHEVAAQGHGGPRRQCNRLCCRTAGHGRRCHPSVDCRRDADQGYSI